MNLLPWRLIKLSVIFPLRDINLSVGEGGMGWGMFWTQTRTFRPLLAVSVSPPGDCDLECGLACLAGMDATEKHLGLEQAHLSGSYKHSTLLGSSSRTNHVPATTLQHGMCYFSLNSSATGAFPRPLPITPPTRQVSKCTVVSDELWCTYYIMYTANNRLWLCTAWSCSVWFMFLTA